MIQKFELIAGTMEEVQKYIEQLPNFHSWQIGKMYDPQIERMLSRDGPMSHIGFVTYQQMTEDGIVIHAAFVAITKNWKLHGNTRSTTNLQQSSSSIEES
jgi:hypothetical protein